MAKVSLIITVLNEEKTIQKLLSSIEAQSKKPDEVVIVDGGSSDKTFTLLKAWKPSFPTVILQKKGNRSVGRNTAIEKAKYDIIAITDAGCILDEHWLRELVKPFSHAEIGVVAGYYTPLTHIPFEKAVAAYMLVMPENIDEENFFFATRSMALRKSVWQQAGKFPEAYTYNEDYVFAHILRRNRVHSSFQKSATVQWIPSSNWASFLKQVYRFAYGDMFSGIVRPKVVLIFVRYIMFVLLLLKVPWVGIAILFVYTCWAVQKNYRYVQTKEAFYLLPLMQFTTDIVVMAGSVVGFMKRYV